MAEKSTVTSGATASGSRIVLFHRPTRSGGPKALFAGLCAVVTVLVHVGTVVVQAVHPLM